MVGPSGFEPLTKSNKRVASSWIPVSNRTVIFADSSATRKLERDVEID
jgi:hypothetical protein